MPSLSPTPPLAAASHGTTRRHRTPASARTRRALQAGGWLVALAGCASALAQPAWPAKPITLMVTVAAGGSIDAIARVIGDELSRSVGQQVLIENRGGAAGNIAALAVVGPQPLAAPPELKALSALGVRGMDDMSGWHGWFAPMGTPAETVRRINAEVARIVAQPKVRERNAAQGAEPATASVEEFARRVVEDMQRVEPVIRRLGLSVY